MEDTQNNIENTSDQDDSNQPIHEEDQRIFEERSTDLINKLVELCEENGVQLDIAVFKDVDSGKPLLFTPHSEYDTAVLLADILRSMKGNINNNLKTE